MVDMITEVKHNNIEPGVQYYFYFFVHKLARSFIGNELLIMCLAFSHLVVTHFFVS